MKKTYQVTVGGLETIREGRVAVLCYSADHDKQIDYPDVAFAVDAEDAAKFAYGVSLTVTIEA